MLSRRPPQEGREPHGPAAAAPELDTVRDLAPDPVAAVGWLQTHAGNAAVSRMLALHRAPAPTLSFREQWERFIPLAVSRSPEVPAVVRRLCAAMEGEDAVSYGTRLVQYALDFGQREVAREVLERMETEYRKRQMRFALKESGAKVTGSDDLPAPGFVNPVDSFIDLGRKAARAGDHVLARELLTRAYLFLQMQLERAGPRGATDEHADLTRMLRYPSLTHAYDQMRAVLGLYPALVRELAGDPAAAAKAKQAGAELRAAIERDFVLTGAEAMIADVSKVDTAAGPALRIHGSTGETDVTQLPGLPSPAEVGSNAYQFKPMEDVHAALEGQIDLVEDLLREPAVVKAFPRGDMDMTKRGDRVKVWKAIYEARKGSGGDLRALMEMIGRCLKAFTVHTEYNIRDFGAKNYVQSEEEGEMARDLAGRAERDCGVYALTVASELSQTAKAESLKLDFELVTTLDHAMLVIKEASGTFYIVSNDTVSAPLTGDVAFELGKIAAGIRGRPVSVMPAMSFDLGSSVGGGGRPQFTDASAWTKYKQAQFGLGGPGDDKEPLYQQYYADQAELERLTGQLEAALQVRRPAGTDEGVWLAQRADALRQSYARLAFLWQQWGTGYAWKPGSAPHGMTLGTGPLTLARYGKMILRRQLLGQPLDQLDQNVLQVCDAIPPMHDQLEAYRAKGMPAEF
jgi:hypothetical protein